MILLRFLNGDNVIMILILIFISSSKNLSASNLLIHLYSKEQEHSNPLKVVTFCMDCPNPGKEGSIVSALSSRYVEKREYSITSELVYCVPNSAESSKILNKYQFKNRIVLVKRGIVSIQEKINSIIKGESKASAIIIIDDGQCDEQFNYCGLRMGGVSDGGFAAFDDKSFWLQLEIPVLLITAKSGQKLTSFMKNELTEIPKLGHHYVTIFDDEQFYDDL